jgi:polyisoprenoid-binding protein YceI
MILLLLLTTLANAFSIDGDFPDFDSAKNSKNFFKFEIEAKKLGLFSSTIEGYAKKFQASATIKGAKIEKASVRIPAKHISTDLYARDDQMWNFCFEEKSYPEIRIDLEDTQIDPGAEKVVLAKMQIRGKIKPIKVNLKRSTSGETYLGETDLAFSQLEIPDPSIGIANVKDSIKVRFQLIDSSEAKKP